MPVQHFGLLRGLRQQRLLGFGEQFFGFGHYLVSGTKQLARLLNNKVRRGQCAAGGGGLGVRLITLGSTIALLVFALPRLAIVSGAIWHHTFPSC